MEHIPQLGRLAFGNIVPGANGDGSVFLKPEGLDALADKGVAVGGDLIFQDPRQLVAVDENNIVVVLELDAGIEELPGFFCASLEPLLFGCADGIPSRSLDGSRSMDDARWHQI